MTSSQLEVYTQNYRPPKLGLQSCKSPNFGNFKTKCHLGAGLMVRHRVYYMGEGGGFPKSRPWWVLWIWVCPWLVQSPKVLKLCISQLVFLFVQARMNDCYLSLFLISSQNSSTPLYPQSVKSQRVCPNSLLFRYFHPILPFEFIKELGSTSHWALNCIHLCNHTSFRTKLEMTYQNLNKKLHKFITRWRFIVIIELNLRIIVFLLLIIVNFFA
jgi:hypothetical protein